MTTSNLLLSACLMQLGAHSTQNCETETLLSSPCTDNSTKCQLTPCSGSHS